MPLFYSFIAGLCTGLIIGAGMGIHAKTKISYATCVTYDVCEKEF